MILELTGVLLLGLDLLFGILLLSHFEGWHYVRLFRRLSRIGGVRMMVVLFAVSWICLLLGRLSIYLGG